MNLNNKIAIVTGAGTGLGSSFSTKLIQEGVKVYGLGRRLHLLQELESLHGRSFIPVQMDITDHHAVSSWIEQTFSPSHSPDILINNAGIGIFGNVESLTPEEWDIMIQTNLSGIFYMTRKVVPLMKQSESSSHIINIASVAGLIGNPKISAYNATKYGLRGFSDSLFKELRFNNIKVTAIFPGSVSTPFFDQTGTETHQNMLQSDDVADSIIHILKTPDNYLISECTIRPLNPKKPDS